MSRQLITFLCLPIQKFSRNVANITNY